MSGNICDRKRYEYQQKFLIESIVKLISQNISMDDNEALRLQVVVLALSNSCS